MHQRWNAGWWQRTHIFHLLYPIRVERRTSLSNCQIMRAIIYINNTKHRKEGRKEGKQQKTKFGANVLSYFVKKENECTLFEGRVSGVKKGTRVSSWGWAYDIYYEPISEIRHHFSIWKRSTNWRINNIFRPSGFRIQRIVFGRKIGFIYMQVNFTAWRTVADLRKEAWAEFLLFCSSLIVYQEFGAQRDIFEKASAGKCELFGRQVRRWWQRD